jgi:succinyl-diaminopimelate desuccinylase
MTNKERSENLSTVPTSPVEESAVYALLVDLLKRKSITPHDEGCQQLLMHRLSQVGFDCVPLNFEDTQNFWAYRRCSDVGSDVAYDRSSPSKQPKPLIVFAGHTDVVPPGDVSRWTSDPFTPTIRDGFLFARGAADMKASLAAFVVACEEFVSQHPQHRGQIAFLITSDEEGNAKNGTVKVCEYLKENNISPDLCVVGEPTSSKQFGDTIKNGRRGSLSAKLKVIGVQGHIAYPHLAKNPIHLFSPALAELVSTHWDNGNDHFPPTTWQVSNIHAGAGATNVTPNEVVIDFNFRFSSESTAQQLKNRVEAILQKHQLTYEIVWNLSGDPFLTLPGTLSTAMSAAIEAELGIKPELSTSGGTSDGRFIAKICPQVIEFGPRNASIHKINECIDLKSLVPLKNIYRRLLENLLLGK